jgi:type II secretion system protein H
LLELVLVMVIACTALAIAAPSMTGWSRGARLRNAAEEFVRLSRYARTQAVSNASVYRIQVEPSTANFWLLEQRGTEWVKVEDSFARNASVPEGGQIQITRSQNDKTSAPGDSAGDTITFYPNGQIQPGRIKISDDTGRSMEVECTTPTEDYHLVIDTENSSS